MLDGGGDGLLDRWVSPPASSGMCAGSQSSGLCGETVNPRPLGHFARHPCHSTSRTWACSDYPSVPVSNSGGPATCSLELEREELTHRVGFSTSQKSSLVIFTYANLCRHREPPSLSVIYTGVRWVRELRPKTEGEALWRAPTVKNLIPLDAVQNRRSSRLRCRARSSARRKLSGQWWISI